MPMFQAPMSAPSLRAPVGRSSNEARERSHPGGERTRSHSQTSHREAPRAQTSNRRLGAEGLKLGVPDTFPNGHPMKHQTSQSTLSEHENGYMQKVVKQEPAVRPASRNAFQVRCCTSIPDPGLPLMVARCTARTMMIAPRSQWVQQGGMVMMVFRANLQPYTSR